MATAAVRESKARYQRAYYRRYKDKCVGWGKAHRERRWAELVEFKADRGCRICGEKDPIVLDFHHRDPATKSFDLNSANATVSRKRMLQEVEKCDVLCANCHRRVEAEIRRGNRISNEEQPLLPFTN